MEKKVCIVMVPYPAQSHLNMALHLSYLISSYNIPIHFVSSSQHINQLNLRNPVLCSNNYQSFLTFHEFFLPSCDDLVSIPLTLPHLRHPVSSLLRHLSSEYSRVVVVFDLLMASIVEDVKGIHNAEAFSFRTVSAFSIFVNVWRAIPAKPFELDSSVPLPNDLPSVEDALLPPDFAAFVSEQWKLSSTIETGLLYNTSRVIEHTYIGLLEKIFSTKKHFAVGPVNNKNLVLSRLSECPITQPAAVTDNVEKACPPRKHECLEWLDQQETESVIYVSFGTTTSPPKEYIHELATGLEKSGQKFLWVLRSSDKGDIFVEGEHAQEEKVRRLLPEGFIERLGNKGKVMTGGWAPQQEILAHPSVGGFMTHCGWGSLTESMSMGVPVIACPVHSDQPLNSVLVTQVLRIGLMIRDDYWNNRAQAVKSDIVANSVKKLMATDEGKGIRARAQELGQDLQRSKAQGGASRLDMDSFIAHVTRA